MSGRVLKLVAPVVALALALAGCGDDDGNGGATALENDFPPPTEAPADAARGGELTVLSSGDVDFIDPGASYFQYTYMVTNAMHRTLLAWRPGDTEQPSPDLAHSEPEISEDGRTVTFTIREGVEFGPPVSREVASADVKYAIERGLLPGVANGYLQTYAADLVGFEAAVAAAERDPTEAPDIAGIETPDERTLRFELDRPTGAVLVQSLSLPISAPVPEEYAAEFDAEEPSTYGAHVVASGPYTIPADPDGELTGYAPGRELRLVRNPNWDPDTDWRPAYLDEITIQPGFADAGSAARKVLAGAAQVNGDFSPPPTVLREAASERPEQLTLTPSGGNRYVTLNITIPPFDDLDVRRAVVAGMDREALRATRGGELLGPVATHFIPPEIPGFDQAGGAEGPELDFLADPAGDDELASEYMRAAGHESGRYEGDESVVLVGESVAPGRETARIVADELEELGFDAELRLVSPDALLTRFCTVPGAEIAVCPNGGWLKDFNDPQSILDPTFSGDSIRKSNNANWSELDDPEVDRAMDEAALIADPEERAEAWGEVDAMVTELAPAVPWIWDLQANVRSEDVAGVINKFTAGWDLSFTSLAGG
ncbi:MAG: ABC transporter substrate-binding protein [Solirubrobacterales bacterium]